MKPHCLPGRHKWRVDNSDPERPVMVCEHCGHYRNDSSWKGVSDKLQGFGIGGGPGGVGAG